MIREIYKLVTSSVDKKKQENKKERTVKNKIEGNSMKEKKYFVYVQSK